MPQSSKTPVYVSARNNSLVKKLRKIAHEPAAYRKYGLIWLEGEHLCQAVCEHNIRPVYAIFAHSLWQQNVALALYQQAQKIIVLDDSLFAHISPLPSASKIGYLLDAKSCMEQDANIKPKTNTLVLDRIQDSGNVGSILRTAAAMNFKQVIALQGTAALWSPKVLRSAMGAHFNLKLIEVEDFKSLKQLQTPLLTTDLQANCLLHEITLPAPCAWIFGNEGQGVQDELLPLSQMRVRIAQPGGEESLNVAAAAAICMYASSAQVKKNTKK